MATPQVALGILRRCEALLMEMTDIEMMVSHLKVDVPKWPMNELQVGRSGINITENFVESA